MLKEKQQFDEAIMSEPSLIPDEFIDPLLGELIRDPVQLPNSKVYPIHLYGGCDR